MATSKTDPLDTVGALMVVFGFIGPIAILGWQAYRWLRDAAWPALPVSAVWDALELPRPHVSWLGVQAILDGLLACPLSGAIFALGMCGGPLLAIAERRRFAAARTIPRNHR